MPDETRDRDDPTLLAEQARESIEKNAQQIRERRVPMETEPPTTFHPDR